MKITSSAFASAKSFSACRRPFGSGRSKGGATVPTLIIVELAVGMACHLRMRIASHRSSMNALGGGMLPDALRARWSRSGGPQAPAPGDWQHGGVRRCVGALVRFHLGETLRAQIFNFLRFGGEHHGALLQECILLLPRLDQRGLSLAAGLFGPLACRLVHDAVLTLVTKRGGGRRDLTSTAAAFLESRRIRAAEAAPPDRQINFRLPADSLPRSCTMSKL